MHFITLKIINCVFTQDLRYEKEFYQVFLYTNPRFPPYCLSDMNNMPYITNYLVVVQPKKSFLGLFSSPWSIDPYRSYYIVFINININISNMVALVINSTNAGDALERF